MDTGIQAPPAHMHWHTALRATEPGPIPRACLSHPQPHAPAHPHPTFAAGVQMTVAGQVAYGVVVFLLEFVPLGGLNPKEAAEYLNAVGGCGRAHVPVCLHSPKLSHEAHQRFRGSKVSRGACTILNGQW